MVGPVREEPGSRRVMRRVFFCIILSILIIGCASQASSNDDRLSNDQLLEIAQNHIEKNHPSYLTYSDDTVFWGDETDQSVIIEIVNRSTMSVEREVDRGDGTTEIVTEAIIGGGYKITIDKVSGKVIEYWATQ